MADRLKLYLFGDQTFDVQPRLQELLHHRSNPILDDFLRKAYDVVRVELAKLPQDTKDHLPRFSFIEDIVLWSKSGKRYVPLDMALTCMYQIGAFIM
jgi:hypothetical protein